MHTTMDQPLWRKLVSVLAALVLAAGMVPVVAGTQADRAWADDEEETAYVAALYTSDEELSAYYSDLQTAIDAANGDTVTLLADVTADVTVSVTVTLDLNGHTLTNASSHTITVKAGGDLTLVDSSATDEYADGDVEGSATGEGVVDNVTTKKAALYVQEGGTATLSGGTLKRSAETGTSTNTYYTVLNQGTLSIEDGTTVELLVYTTDDDGNVTTTAAGYSSVIDNGWYSGSPTTDDYFATLYINGGYVNGGKYVKNDSYGVMYITGGTIAGSADASAILNWNTLSVSGGTIESDGYCAILNCATDGTTYETGSVTITGGTFVYGDDDDSAQLLATNSTSSEVEISGGTFSSSVDEYLDEDAVAVTVTVDGVTYTYVATSADDEDEDDLTADDAAVAIGCVASLATTETDDEGDESTTTTYYTDLQEAVSKAASGDVVTMLTDVTISHAYLLISTGLTLDLGSNTLTFAYSSEGNYRVGLYISDGDVTIKNGTIADERCNGHAFSTYLITIDMYGDSLATSDLTVTAYDPNYATYNYIIYAFASGENYPAITLGSGTEIEGKACTNEDYSDTTKGCVGVTLLGATSSTDAAALAESDDTSTYTSLTVKDGASISTTGFAIAGSGSKHGTVITINGGTITSTGSTAIYHPQYGYLYVNGGTITGAETGIEIRAGHLIMTGGTVTGQGAPTETQANGNGTTCDGAGIAVSQHTTNLALSVTIKGGTVSGYTALYEEDTTGDGDVSGISLSISGGTFVATGEESDAVYSVDVEAFVSGGIFSTAVAASYCAEGYSPTGPVVPVTDEDGEAVTDDDGNPLMYYTVAKGTIDFWGGSLRMDGYTDDDGNTIYTKTSMRLGFCWDDLPDDATVTAFGWTYLVDSDEDYDSVEEVSSSDLTSSATGSNKREANPNTYAYDQSDSGTVANLVFTNISSTMYDTAIYAQMYVTYEYTDDDGDTVSVTIYSDVVGRDVLYVASGLSSCSSDSDVQTYASSIVSAADDDADCSHAY